MKVYISCHHPGPANDLAVELAGHGHEVVSTWHRSKEPRPADGDAAAWAMRASANLAGIRQHAQVLVVVASPEHVSGERRVPGGKFVEAGYAIANGIIVATLGGVENQMLRHPLVMHAADVRDLLAILSAG